MRSFGKFVLGNVVFVCLLFGQKPNLNNDTVGTLNLNRGGTGSTTAATARTVLGVRAYGAERVCDTDNFATLQACHDDLPAGGGKLFIPAGTYTLSSVLTISKSDVLIQGAGWLTKIQYDSPSSWVINVTGSRVIISDLEVKNLDVTGGNVAINIAINVTDVTIERCLIEGSPTQGININATGVKRIKAIGNFFNGTRFGVLVNLDSTDARDIAVIGNTCINSSGGTGQGHCFAFNTPGAALTGLRGFTVIGNLCESAQNCVAVAGGYFGTISGNVIRNATSKGIHVEDDSAHITISNNVIDGVANHATDCPTCNDGIHVIDGDYITIADNEIYNANDRGIAIEADGSNGPTRVIVKGNIVRGSGVDGLRLATNSGIDSYLLAEGNILANNTSDGIEVTGTGTLVKIANNFSSGNTGYGLNISAATTLVSIFGNDLQGNTAGASTGIPVSALVLGNRGTGVQYVQSRYFWGCSGAVSSSVTRMLTDNTVACSTAITADTTTRIVVPSPGILRNLRVHHSGTTAANTVYTVRKNESDSIITCTVSAGGSTCNDTTNEVSVVAGDRVSVKMVTGISETFTDPKVSLEF